MITCVTGGSATPGPAVEIAIIAVGTAIQTSAMRGTMFIEPTLLPAPFVQSRAWVGFVGPVWAVTGDWDR
ncbi:hypothetical protein MUNTM_29930 [Mycobacterium sp. MUNTM1]